MAEQLFRVCPECGGRGYIETDQRIEVSPENEFAIRASCVPCSGTGYLPIDAPEPLTEEEIIDCARFAEVTRTRARSVIAALPARFGVRMEGTTDET